MSIREIGLAIADLAQRRGRVEDVSGCRRRTEHAQQLVVVHELIVEIVGVVLDDLAEVLHYPRQLARLGLCKDEINLELAVKEAISEP